MKMVKYIQHVVFGIMTLTLMLSGCAQLGIESGKGGGSVHSSSPSESSATAALTTGPNRISAGSQDDTIKACLARIPKNSTAGPRMLAAKSCERDQNYRHPIEQVPGR